jgi:hypothetical protein
VCIENDGKNEIKTLHLFEATDQPSHRQHSTRDEINKKEIIREKNNDDATRDVVQNAGVSTLVLLVTTSMYGFK